MYHRYEQETISIIPTNLVLILLMRPCFATLNRLNSADFLVIFTT